MSLLRLDAAAISFGHVALLDNASLVVEAKERIALLGRNGTGKSTLLRVLSKQIELDSGEYWHKDNLRIAYLAQEVAAADDSSVFDIIASALSDVGELLTQYHSLTSHLSENSSEKELLLLEKLQQKLEVADGWRLEQQINYIISKLDLNADEKMCNLSGGLKRRVLLARTLVTDPEVLLLDEPTNHLDIEAIKWLENFLLNFKGTLIFITHDRRFLQDLATRIIELDRGVLTSYSGDYKNYLLLKEKFLEQQAQQNALFDKKLSEEEKWIRQGIKARRTRNEGRVRALEDLRKQRAERRKVQGNVKFSLKNADISGNSVVELIKVSFSYDKCKIINNFSTRIMRGDRIGIIGANGVGKTTFVKLLLGELQADKGKIKSGTKLEIAYFDQQRAQLDLQASVFDNLNDGQDHVVVQGKSRHVMSYLRDFLFSAERVRSPVKTLSGGERNRLLLARLFTQPANLLVLDEPTNDLDIETLELLESLLTDYTGTLLLISHDRFFIDNVVSSTLVMSGNGEVKEYVGGYMDYIRQASDDSNNKLDQEKTSDQAIILKDKSTNSTVTKTKKLGYNEQRELELLPIKIEQLELQQQQVLTLCHAADFYNQDKSYITATQDQLKEISTELEKLYTRWQQLEDNLSC